MTGSGTSGDPYILSSVADLQAVIATGLDKYYELGADIDMSSISTWTPIGNYDTAFTGAFNGAGHEITNFTMTGAMNLKHIGFFGSVSTSLDIKNITFTDVNINVTSNAYGVAFGVLAGDLLGGGKTSNVKIKDGTAIVYSSGGGWPLIGGIAGKFGMTSIKWCSVDGLSLTYSSIPQSSIGLFIGKNTGGLIKECYASGNVSAQKTTGGNLQNLGGFIGEHYAGSIQDCYTRTNCSIGGTVDSDSTLSGFASTTPSTFVTTELLNTYAAGIHMDMSVGKRNGYTNYQGCNFDLSNSYFDDTILGSAADKLGGGTSYDSAEAKDTTRMKTQSTFVGWDFATVWAIDIDQIINNGYPYFINNPPFIPANPKPPVNTFPKTETGKITGAILFKGTEHSPLAIANIYLANTRLGAPSYDKRLKYIDIDYRGEATLNIYTNQELLISFNLPNHPLRGNQRLFIPLWKRIPKEEVQLTFVITDPDFIFYNLECELDVEERRYV